jgi:hypothetical protein
MRLRAIKMIKGVFRMSQALMLAVDELRLQARSLAAQIMEDERVAQMRKILAGLNTLEDLCGQPKTSLGSLLNFSTDETPVSSISVQPDEFYGLDPLVAAKRFLKKPGKAVPFKEIVTAVRAGGGDPGNEEKLKVSLARSTWDVVKIGDDLFGLLEFYPHVKRGKKAKAGNGEAVVLQDSVNVEMKDTEGETVLTDASNAIDDEDAKKATAGESKPS